MISMNVSVSLNKLKSIFGENLNFFYPCLIIFLQFVFLYACFYKYLFLTRSFQFVSLAFLLLDLFIIYLCVFNSSFHIPVYWLIFKVEFLDVVTCEAY